MGKFTFYCLECGIIIEELDAVVILFIEKHEVKEWIEIWYDLLGCCLCWTYLPWRELARIHANDDTSSGFTAYHQECFRGIYGSIRDLTGLHIHEISKLKFL